MKAKISSISLIFVCVFIVMIGCQRSLRETSADKFTDHSWTFHLKFGSSLTLADNQHTTIAELQQQLSSIEQNKFTFLDPGWRGSFFNDPVENVPSGFFYTGSINKKSSTHQWRFSNQVYNKWRFSNCSAEISGEIRYLPCEIKTTIECLSQRMSAFQNSNSEQISSSYRSLLLNFSQLCGFEGSFENLEFQDVSFKIVGNEIQFSPAPLLSILIYEGAWASYEEALVRDVAVATLPQVVPCNRADALCLMSPVPLSQCRNCQEIEKGKIYTVFFIEGLRQDYQSVRSLIIAP